MKKWSSQKGSPSCHSEGQTFTNCLHLLSFLSQPIFNLPTGRRRTLYLEQWPSAPLVDSGPRPVWKQSLKSKLKVCNGDFDFFFTWSFQVCWSRITSNWGQQHYSKGFQTYDFKHSSLHNWHHFPHYRNSHNPMTSMILYSAFYMNP